MEAVIQSILNRGVEDIIERDSIEKRLHSGEKLRIKFGIDPTGPMIHLGRAIPLRKLQKFQELGHTIVLIIGDFTATIGDPSDKLEKRPELSREQIEENMKSYRELLGKIIDIDRAELHYNSTWLAKLTFREVCNLADTFTVQQMIHRRNFRERIEGGKEISLKEFLYPLMQGYDSVVVEADIEIGGFDQLFNLKAGRTIQRYHNKKEQDILTTQMLEGTDGRKMSTSWGNVITITDEPNDMYGKIMSLKDELIVKYFLLCTDVSLKEIQNIEKALIEENPKKYKMQLAHEIVSIYHGTGAADNAEESFATVFTQGALPADVIEVTTPSGTLLKDVVTKQGLVESNSAFTRLLNEGAITQVEHGEKITDQSYQLTESGSYKIGKRRFIKIVVEK